MIYDYYVVTFVQGMLIVVLLHKIQILLLYVRKMCHPNPILVFFSPHNEHDVNNLTSTGRMSIKRQMNQRDTTSVHMTLFSTMACQTAGTLIFTSSPSTSWSVFRPNMASV